MLPGCNQKVCRSPGDVISMTAGTQGCHPSSEGLPGACHQFRHLPLPLWSCEYSIANHRSTRKMPTLRRLKPCLPQNHVTSNPLYRGQKPCKQGNSNRTVCAPRLSRKWVRSREKSILSFLVSRRRDCSVSHTTGAIILGVRETLQAR
jgi:hypothetical protein